MCVCSCSCHIKMKYTLYLQRRVIEDILAGCHGNPQRAVWVLRLGFRVNVRTGFRLRLVWGFGFDGKGLASVLSQCESWRINVQTCSIQCKMNDKKKSASVGPLHNFPLGCPQQDQCLHLFGWRRVFHTNGMDELPPCHALTPWWIIIVGSS